MCVFCEALLAPSLCACSLQRDRKDERVRECVLKQLTHQPKSLFSSVFSFSAVFKDTISSRNHNWKFEKVFEETHILCSSASVNSVSNKIMDIIAPRLIFSLHIQPDAWVNLCQYRKQKLSDEKLSDFFHNTLPEIMQWRFVRLGLWLVWPTLTSWLAFLPVQHVGRWQWSPSVRETSLTGCSVLQITARKNKQKSKCRMYVLANLWL